MIHEKIALWEGRDDVTLTTYVLDRTPEICPDQKRPAVLVLPGGAYVNCSDREAEPVALRFQAMGYHAFVLRYSVYTENKSLMDFAPGQDLPPKPRLTHPAPMRDIARAMLEIRANAEKWNVDADRVALCGFSAGAHNCAMYSVYWDKPVLSEPFGVDNALLRPAACILGYALSDYVFQNSLSLEGAEPWVKGVFEMCNFAFTGTKNPPEKLLAELSPARLVGPGTPPMFLWATAKDNLVPVQHTILMANALADASVPFEMHIFEDGDHGLSTADRATASFQSQIDPNAAKWIPLCESWLEKRFSWKIPVSPAMPQ